MIRTIENRCQYISKSETPFKERVKQDQLLTQNNFLLRIDDSIVLKK